MHFGVGQRPGRGGPLQGVAGGRGLQEDVLAQLVGAAPQEQLAPRLVRHVAEWQDPHGVIAVAAAQHGHDGGQPVVVVDPGGGAGRVEFDLPGRDVTTAHPGREEVVAPAGAGQAQLARLATGQPTAA